MSLHDWIIFQLIDSRNSGGIETHILNLSGWLKRHGYQTRVIFINDYGPHPLKDQLNEAGIEWQISEGWRALYKQLRHHPSMLATHGYKAGILGRVTARLARVPVVSTYHAGDLGEGRLRLYSMLDTLSAPLANQIISVSPEIADRLPCDCSQLPNFVSTGRYRQNKGKKIAFVGRLSHEKGPDCFAQITATLSPLSKLASKGVTKNANKPADKSVTQPVDKNSDVTEIAVFGDGPMREALQNHYHHMYFHGQVDMQAHWDDVGLLCITSRCEGLPLVALEAMARGIPVASFAIGALPQLIQHGKNGWLIPPQNFIRFQKVIQSWQQSTATERSCMSLMAYQTIRQRFSCDVVGPKVIDVYRQALPALAQMAERS